MTFNDMGDQYNAATGAIKRVLLVQSSITFHCIAKTGPEAQNIAYQVISCKPLLYDFTKWGILGLCEIYKFLLKHLLEQF